MTSQPTAARGPLSRERPQDEKLLRTVRGVELSRPPLK
jgi:hypothetical protein